MGTSIKWEDDGLYERLYSRKGDMCNEMPDPHAGVYIYTSSYLQISVFNVYLILVNVASTFVNLMRYTKYYLATSTASLIRLINS